MSRFPRYLSFIVGFLSLSQEILWVKLVSFIHQTRPQAFAFVLALYLLGIAFGAQKGKRICATSNDLYFTSFKVLLLAGILDVLFPLSTGLFFGWDTGKPVQELLLTLGMVQQAFGIMLTAFLKGIIFPIAHHLGTVEKDGKVGTSVSKVYFFNIVGSTLGPIVTGFYLLNVLDLQSCFLLMAVLTLATATACGLKAGISKTVSLPFTGTVMAVILVAHWTLPEILIRQIAGASEVKYIIQNRHGIIHVLEGGPAGDRVYGGNTYDGRFNTDLIINSNGINRAYMLTAFHPGPKRILEIGLSSASWTKVMSGFDGLERIDCIEINPGYIQLIERTHQVSSILKDPRIHLHIDDGRRWLKMHPDDRFDMVVINTTYHWKNFSSNMLSKEFQELVKKHLNPGGVFFYNSTGSGDALKTAATVFKHAYLYSNFVIASDQDVKQNIQALSKQVYKVQLDGHPALRQSEPEDVKAVQRMLALPLVTVDEMEAKVGRPLEVITDQNMITEFKYGQNI